MARSILPANSVTEPVKKKSVATAASPAKKDSVKPAPAVVVDHKPNPLESIGTWFVEFGDNARVLQHTVSSFFGLGDVDREKVAVLKQLETRLFDGTLSKIITEDCTITLTGQTMPAADFADVCVACKKAFPEWNVDTDDHCSYTLGGDVKMGTRQKTGPMKANMKAVGPFPAVALKDAPAAIKKAPGLILPVEIGIFTFDESGGGLRIKSMKWDGRLGDTSEANTMDQKPPVGMPVLFAAMGTPLV